MKAPAREKAPSDFFLLSIQAAVTVSEIEHIRATVEGIEARSRAGVGPLEVPAAREDASAQRWTNWIAC